MWWVLVGTVLQSLMPQTPVRDAAPPKEGTAIIRGRVTDKESGLPLAGIVVKVPSAGAGQPALETRTDADGHYELTRVPAGTHILVATMPEYRASHLTQVYGDARLSRAQWTWRVPARFEIKDREVRTGVDFALLRALAIGGRVVDDRGQPMSDVRVRVESLSDADSATRPRDTDDLGLFRLFGLAPGRYRICAEPMTLVYTYTAPPDAPAATCYPPPGRDADAVVVDMTELAPIQIQMPRGRTVRVTGVVLDASGTPTETASVSLVKDISIGTTGYSVPVSAGGQFTARGVTPGDYSIQASANSPLEGGRLERQLAYVPLRVGTSDVDGIVVSLMKPATLRGKVFAEDAPGLPEGTRLTMQAHGDRRLSRLTSGVTPTAIVGEDMSFQLTGLFGEVTLTCSGLPSGWVVKGVRYGGRDVTDVPLAVDAEARPLEVVLSSRGAIASGNVADDGGIVSAGHATVVVFPADVSRWTGRPPLTVVSKDGTFRSPSVRAGEYLIAAFDGSEIPTRPDGTIAIERFAQVAERITLGEGERRTIDLRIVRIPEDW